LAQPDIFLSYNREDAEIARRFADAFAADGFEVWWDQALRSGEAYDEVTEAALRNAKAVVVLWSKRSVASRWVRAEASIADENGTLTPVKIEACDLPVMFRLTQTADLSGWQGAADDRAWLAFLGDVRRMAGKDAPAAKAAPPAVHPAAAASGAGVPKAGVLPFAIRGDDPDLTFLTEDLTEDVTHALADNDYFKVIASGTMATWRGAAHDYKAIGQQVGARYLVEGRLQRVGENMRLAVQLIDTSTANAVWSHRFAESTDEIAANPEDFPRIVASELAEQVMQAETKRAMTKPGPYTGWEHLLRCFSLVSVESADHAIKVFEELRGAIAVAPDYGLAHAMLASQTIILAIEEGAKIEDDMKRETREHMTRALQLDGNNPAVIRILVNAAMGLGDGESALRLARRAVELRPASPLSHFFLGNAYLMFGRTADAIAAYDSQLRCKGFDSARSNGLWSKGWCHLLEGNAEQAEEALEHSLALNPNYASALKLVAVAQALLGKERAATASVQRLRDVVPDASLDQHLATITANPRLRRMSQELIETFRRLWDATEPSG